MRHVGIAFMLHVDYRTLEAFAGVQLLARETGMSRKTVGKALAELRRQGWLRRTSRGNSFTGHSDTHRLSWPRWFDR